MSANDQYSESFSDHYLGSPMALTLDTASPHEFMQGLRQRVWRRQGRFHSMIHFLEEVGKGLVQMTFKGQ